MPHPTSDQYPVLQKGDWFVVSIRGAQARRLGWGRSVRVGFLVSVAVHAAMLAIPVRQVPHGGSDAMSDSPPSARGLRLLTLVDHEGSSAPAPAPIQRAPEPPNKALPKQIPDTPVVGLGSWSEAAVLDEPSPPKRLSPGFTDPRLSPRLHLSSEVVNRARAERGRLHSAFWRHQEDVTGEASEGTTAWITRAGSRTWGAAPGKLFFGSKTLTLCSGTGLNLLDCGFGSFSHTLGAQRDYGWRLSEIDRQVERSETRTVWRERAAAIRAQRILRSDTLDPVS